MARSPYNPRRVPCAIAAIPQVIAANIGRNLETSPHSMPETIFCKGIQGSRNDMFITQCTIKPKLGMTVLKNVDNVTFGGGGKANISHQPFGHFRFVLPQPYPAGRDDYLFLR